MTHCQQTVNVQVPLMRTPFRVTLSVWKALFLRESLSRLFASRASWAWLLIEPMIHVAFMMVMFSVIRLRHVGGFETPMWIMLGLLSFFFFKRTFGQVQNAVHANQALYAYRQVRPIDALLVRAVLEAVVMTVIASLTLIAAALGDLSIMPSDPLMALLWVQGLWWVGLGVGMMASVATELVPEMGHVIKFAMTPLYFMSGVILPLSVVPMPYREWLMINPLAHGVEGVRLAFADHYHAVPELSLSYLYGFALVCVFLGLALQRRFEWRLQTQ